MDRRSPSTLRQRVSQVLIARIMSLGAFCGRQGRCDVWSLAILLVAYCGLARAQFGVPTGVLNLGAISGATTPVSASAPLFANGPSGPRTDFHLSVEYTGNSQGWLSVSPITGTTPQNVVMTANPSNLPVGTYLARVVANFDSLNGSAVTTVALTVAPGGVNPKALAANPTALVFLPDALDPQTITVGNAPAVSGTIPFRSFATSTGWLNITQSSGTSPGVIKVQVDATQLTAGPHTGTITITTPTQENTVVPVSIVIPEQGIGPTIDLTPAQQALTFNFQLGTTFNPAQIMYVSSGSTQYTGYTAMTSVPWIGVSAASWLTPARAAQTYAPGLLYVFVDPTGLDAGTYKGTVTLSGGGSSVDIPVTLNVSATAVLNANPSFVTIDASTGVLTANLAVTASEAFFFTASAAGNSGWLSVSPTAGVASNNIINLTVTAKTGGLPSGTFSGTITLAGPSGSPTLVIPVQFKVSGSATTDSVSIDPTALEFSTIAGDPIPPQYLMVSGSPFLNEDYVIAANSEQGWLTVDPSIGATPLLAKATINPATPAGVYTGSIVVTSLTTQQQATASVKFTSTARVMKASPSSLTFTQPFNASAPASQEIQITANAISTFRVTAQSAWVKMQPVSSFATPAKLVVRADPTGMTPGNYQGSIQLTGPNTITIQVVLTIDSPPPAAVSPSSVSFAYELGSAAPGPQSVTVNNPAVTTTFTAVASTASGVPWLAVTPADGSTPGAITLSVQISQLTIGEHKGTITVTFGASGVAPLTIPVTLTVSGTAVQVRQVLNGATLAPTSVAPGQIVTLTGLGLGPSSAAIARPSAAGAFATELAGVQVSFDGVPAPLLMAQEGQINAIVPYAAFGRATARLQVQVGSSYSVPIEVNVVNSAPGIFTSGPSGRGQAAALNADGSLNSILNPAPRGSIVVVYITGEGQTDPPGQDGRVITSDLRLPLATVTASIGGRPATVLYAGSAPSQVAGVCQVNIQIPENADAGAQPIEIRAGNIPTQSGVTVALR